MIVLRTVEELRADRSGVSGVGLVPTMGAFHEGHLALMRACAAQCSRTYVSLFVNPTQFGEGEDFEAYPRDEARDFELASSAGVDVMFAPPVAEVYTAGVRTIHAGAEARLWEGEHRPGHFDGVATVVARLFEIVQPEIAFFGLKDLQQCAVIRSMVRREGLPVRLSFLETVREASGLAMSSRNAYFSAEQRSHVAVLFRVLTDCALSLQDGRSFEAALLAARLELEDQGFDVDYVACVNPETMEPAHDHREGLRVIAAARIYGVRLIDNVPV